MEEPIEKYNFLVKILLTPHEIWSFADRGIFSLTRQHIDLLIDFLEQANA